MLPDKSFSFKLPKNKMLNALVLQLFKNDYFLTEYAFIF